MNTELQQKRMDKVTRACEMLNQAYELREQAEKLLRQCGVILCSEGTSCYEPDAKRNVHVYRGLKKLGQIVGIELRPPLNTFYEPVKRQKAVVTNGLCFFQLGHATERAYKYE